MKLGSANLYSDFPPRPSTFHRIILSDSLLHGLWPLAYARSTAGWRGVLGLPDAECGSPRAWDAGGWLSRAWDPGGWLSRAWDPGGWPSEARGLAIRGLRFRGGPSMGWGAGGGCSMGWDTKDSGQRSGSFMGCLVKGGGKAHCRVHGSVVWCSMGLLLWGELHRWTEPECRVCVCALWMQHSAWRCRRHCRITARVDMRAAM